MGRGVRLRFVGLAIAVMVAAFAAQGQARTFDFQENDVGYVPFAMGHYIENTGTTPLRFLEMFKSSYYADLSLDTWMALTPPELVRAHLNLDRQVVDAFAYEQDTGRAGLSGHSIIPTKGLGTAVGDAEKRE